MAEKKDLSLSEALELASKYVNTFRSFQMIYEVLEKARQVEGQRDSEWNAIEARTAQLKANEAEVRQALQEANDLTEREIAAMQTMLAEVKADHKEQLELSVASLEQAKDQHAKQIATMEASHKAKRDELAADISLLMEQRGELETVIQQLQKQREDLVAQFKKLVG